MYLNKIWSISQLEKKDFKKMDIQELRELREMLGTETFYAKGNEKKRLLDIESKIIKELMFR